MELWKLAIIFFAVYFPICWWCNQRSPKDPELIGVSLNPFKGDEWDWWAIFYWVVIIGVALIGLFFLDGGGGGYEEWELPYRY